MNEKIRVAVVGGNFGENHIKGYQQCPGIEVVAVCRRQKELAEELAQRHKVQKFYTDFNELIRAKDIDVVSLAVPNHLHHPMTLMALDNGKHVVCEKPLALNVKQATEMLKKAQEKNLINMTVFNWRFVPAILLMKELIEKGEVGSIRHIFFEWLTGGRKDRESRFFWRFDRSEAGFGALGDTGAHIIDLIHWMFGNLKSVVSHMSIQVPEHKISEGEYKKSEVEDACSFLGELNDGAQVLFHVTSVAYSESLIRLEVYGDKGILGGKLNLGKTDFYGQLLGGKGEKSLDRVIPFPERLQWDTSDAVENVTPRSLFFASFAKQLVKAIQTGETPSPNFFDGLKVQEVLEALLLSWDKKEWINLARKTV